MGKQVRVVEAVYRFEGNYPPAKVRGYLTQTAGLCVVRSHRLKINTDDHNVTLVTGRTWDIIQYPYGATVIQGLSTKKFAIEVAEHELSKFSWVFLLRNDFEKNNDMKKLRETLLYIREKYGI